MILFALNSSRAFGERVAHHLQLPLCPHEEREFEDGEHKARPLVSVRGRDAFVIQSLHGSPEASVNDKLCRLLFFIATLRDNGARRVTAAIPYLAYARKDRQTKARDPITTRYVAQLLEAAGADGVIALEVHSVAAFQNAFRCRSVHLDTGRLFAAHIQSLRIQGPLIVASPDPGGVKRAQLFRDHLQRAGLVAGHAFFDKRRSAGVVSGETMVGDVSGATVLVVDDLIASGATMTRAAKLAQANGARAVIAVAAHGLFTGLAPAEVASAPVTRWVITDSVPPFRLDPRLVKERVDTVSACPLFAEAIGRVHQGGSITALLGQE